MKEGLLLDLRLPLDRFPLEIRWETDETSLGVFGHSGAGKTTLLEAIAGLRRTAEGRIVVTGTVWLDTAHGVRLPPERRHVGYVPQDALLFPHLEVSENIRFGEGRAARPGARRHGLARIIEVLELGDLGRRRVTTLSGGERQRVALARALASAPDLLLLDEPLAGLDLPLRRRILPYLLRVRDEFEVPTLFVSHDATEVRMLAREVAVLRDGKVLAAGHPDAVLTDPAVYPMAAAEGVENVLAGTVIARSGPLATIAIEDGLVVHVPAGALAVGDHALVSLPPNDVILALEVPARLSARNILQGVVAAVRRAPEALAEAEDAPAAGTVWVRLDVGTRGRWLVAELTEAAADEMGLGTGTTVHAVFKAQSCRVLPLPPAEPRR